MSIMTIPINVFKKIIQEQVELDTIDQFCNDHCYYNEWINLTYSERRDMFNDYLQDNDIEKIIKDKYWRDIWKTPPTLLGKEIQIFV